MAEPSPSLRIPPRSGVWRLSAACQSVKHTHHHLSPPLIHQSVPHSHYLAGSLSFCLLAFVLFFASCFLVGSRTGPPTLLPPCLILVPLHILPFSPCAWCIVRQRHAKGRKVQKKKRKCERRSTREARGFVLVADRSEGEGHHEIRKILTTPGKLGVLITRPTLFAFPSTKPLQHQPATFC